MPEMKTSDDLIAELTRLVEAKSVASDIYMEAARTFPVSLALDVVRGLVKRIAELEAEVEKWMEIANRSTL